MKKVTMLRSQFGSENGFDVQLYLKGRTYDLAEGLACQFLQGCHAYLAEDDDGTPAPAPTPDSVVELLLRSLRLPTPEQMARWRNPPLNPATDPSMGEGV
ncbi:MAG: hypothetical protein K8U57_37075 [Planctomycetes bacterium]|nr:hypothetical protein [Planctomycetota bacterium]